MDCSLPGSPPMGFSGQEYWSGVPLPSKLITNEDLLYSIGNSTQFSVMAYMGKESKNEWIYMYV